MMTADDAAKSWLIRVTEIIGDYKTSGPSEQLWYQSSTAANGITALLQARFQELSSGMVTRLGQAVDVCADIKAKSLGAAKGSPLADATQEFFDSIRETLMRWRYVADKGRKDLTGDLSIVLVLVLAILIFK